MINIRKEGRGNMQKDERPESYIEEFNRGHRRIKREEKDWYVPYLPRGLNMEDITEREDKELMLIFTKAEEEMEQEFEELVRERFIEFFEKKSLSGIMEYLPQKPHPITYEELSRKDREKIKEFYTTGIEEGYTKKTIRKQIRHYLDEKGYLRPKKKVEEKKKVERKNFRAMLLPYLPQHPVPVPFESLTPEDRDAVIKLYTEGMENGYTKKTIRKHIRRYLEDRGYFREKEKKKSSSGKTDWKVVLASYLPQHPVPITYDQLKKADRAGVRKIYTTGRENNYALKTIRRQIRAHLKKKGYIKDGATSRTSKKRTKKA